MFNLMRTGTAVLIGLSIVTIGGCGTVRPEGDYARAGALVGGRTGAAETYDPSDEAAIHETLEALLADGLTEQECVQLALLNNRAFQSQFQEIGVSRAEFVQSGLFSNPTLSFSSRFLDVGGRANLSFGLAQELVDLWQIPVRRRVAKDKLESTILAVATSAVDLAARTRTAYFQALAREGVEAVAADNQGMLQETLALTQRRFDAGEATALDKSLVRAAALDGAVRLAGVRRDREVAFATLEHLLGVSPDQGSITLAGADPGVARDLEDESVLLQRALSNRLDVRMASLALDAAAAEISGQRRALVPSVALGLDGERPDQTSASAPKSLGGRIAAAETAIASPSQALRDRVVQRIDDARQRKSDKAQAVDLLLGPSLQVTVPLFDQNRAQVAKARFQFAQKQKDYEELLLAVVDEVRQARANASALGEMYRIVVQEALPLAEANVGTAQRAYEAGEESILALLLAQQNLNSQREARATAAGDYAGALAELERALGGRTASEQQGGAP